MKLTFKSILAITLLLKTLCSFASFGDNSLVEESYNKLGESTEERHMREMQNEIQEMKNEKERAELFEQFNNNNKK